MEDSNILVFPYIFTAIRGSLYKIGAKENLHVNVSRYKIMNIKNE